MEASYRGPQLIPLKVVIFFLFAAIGSLIPFLSIHVKELGMSAEETGFIYMVAGFFSLLGPIFGGILTEKHGKFKPVIVIFILLAAASYTGLLFIPRAIRMPVRTPESEFSCDGNKVSILLEKCPNWGRCYASDRNLSSRFEAYSCRYYCQDNVTFFKSTELCFQSTNTKGLCRTFNASILDDTLKISITNLFPKAITTKLTKLPKMTEMCVYSVTNVTISDTYFKNVTCQHKKQGCDFICHLREVKSNDGKKSVFDKFPPCLEIFGDPFMTFYLYLAVRSFADMCLLTVISLIDTVTVLSISDYKGHYGRSRVWSALGLSIFGPVSGVLIDYYSEVEGEVNYSPAFVIFDGFMLITAVLTIALPITKYIIEDSVKSSCTKCLKLCQSAEGLILFLLVLILGMLWGFLDIFLYWFAFDIGANKLLIGIFVSAAFICSTPFLAFSESIIRGFGKANLIVYAFLFYCIRYVGYSFLDDPKLIIPFQAMEVFTLSLLWIGIVAYAHSIAPPGLRVTTQGTVSSLHFCAGRGIGGFLGAMLIHLFGMTLAFRGVGVFCAVVGIIYWLAHMCCFRQKYKHPSQEPPPPGIALTGTYYPMADRNNHSSNNRQPNGYAKHREARLMDDHDDEFHSN